MIEIANGKKPKMEIGMVFRMEDGSNRKILSFDAGTGGEVTFKVRASSTGQFRREPVTIKRRAFWRGVTAYKPAPEAA